MMCFWFDKGIDGFRMDVIPFLSKDSSFPPLPPEWPDGFNDRGRNRSRVAANLFLAFARLLLLFPHEFENVEFCQRSRAVSRDQAQQLCGTTLEKQGKLTGGNLI
jgi:hypothetical protein